MSSPNFPTLLYPNGGEIIVTNEIVVQWQTPDPFDTDGRTIAFELYYTDRYDANNEPDWIQITSLPETTSQFVWQFDPSIRSSTCRVAICSRNSRGEKSRFSVSAGNFSINRKKLTTPAILVPINGQIFDKTIEIIPDDNAILGTYSARSFYQFYYSSVSLNISKSLIAQNIAVGSGTVTWNILNLPAANDYIIEAFLADDDGNISDSTFIKNIQISHAGFFIIDTIPPETSIVINNGATFTDNPDVSIQIASYDKATAVQSILLQDSGQQSAPELPSDIQNYTLSNGDAIKVVELLAQDFGANRNSGLPQRTFNIDIGIIDGSANDIAVDSAGTVWAITSLNQLYKITQFPSLATTFDDEPTAIASFGAFIYVATQSNGMGTLYSYTGFDTEEIIAFSSTDSTINTMVAYNNLLFMGMENGSVYTFDGITTRLVSSVPFPVKTLFTDGNLLYLTEKNSSSIFAYQNGQFITVGNAN